MGENLGPTPYWSCFPNSSRGYRCFNYNKNIDSTWNVSMEPLFGPCAMSFIKSEGQTSAGWVLAKPVPWAPVAPGILSTRVFPGRVGMVFRGVKMS